MPLQEDARFARAPFALPARALGDILDRCRETLRDTGWTYCGYAPLVVPSGLRAPDADICAPVDNGFRLGPLCGFEQLGAVVTAGLRTSRFAPILFWEVLHTLAPGGVWIDVDESRLCGGTPLIDQDHLAREYAGACLEPAGRGMHGSVLVQTFRKVAPTAIATHIDDRRWTFGILTSGPSPRAAQMASAILALDLPQVEVIFCGPRPSGVADDDRVRALDLDRPEPRGWITRKKNLLADAARHDNLCLLHDRYVVTPAWADALERYGPCYAFVTFPQAYYADRTRRFPQRYPDYQVLRQRAGFDAALATNIYDSERVFHPAYEDFAESAFCCGGLYIARRSLWNLVRQDEGLFHCEWEDISFGLECQRRGLPHRVNTQLTAESTAAHPLLLTRRHDLAAPDQPERRRLHVTVEQQAAAQIAPDLFKPVMAMTREHYYAHVQRRFNLTAGLRDADRLTDEAIAGCERLSDFWRTLDCHIQGLPLAARDHIAQIGFFLSDTIYKWPTCQVLSWVRAYEDRLTRGNPLAGVRTVVGWGSGSLFRSAHRGAGRPLAFTIDSDPARWGMTVDGIDVRAPEALCELDPATSAVIVFSCFVSDITAAIARLGAFAVVPASAVTAARRFGPLAEIVAHFEEVERYYPTLFADPAQDIAA